MITTPPPPASPAQPPPPPLQTIHRLVRRLKASLNALKEALLIPSTLQTLQNTNTHNEQQHKKYTERTEPKSEQLRKKAWNVQYSFKAALVRLAKMEGKQNNMDGRRSTSLMEIASREIGKQFALCEDEEQVYQEYEYIPILARW